MSASLQFILILWLLPMAINIVLAKRLKLKVARTILLSLLFSGFLTSFLSWKLLVELSTATAKMDGDNPGAPKLKRAKDRYSCFLSDIDLASGEPPAATNFVCPACGRNNRRGDQQCFNCGIERSGAAAKK
ncbi:MAG: hypothetical protein OEV64_10615 [Desulfobulbaceae bacterium]|nr:hypothetical protein [Desulfobulbaceae bacterium]